MQNATRGVGGGGVECDGVAVQQAGVPTEAEANRGTLVARKGGGGGAPENDTQMSALESGEERTALVDWWCERCCCSPHAVLGRWGGNGYSLWATS